MTSNSLEDQLQSQMLQNQYPPGVQQQQQQQQHQQQYQQQQPPQSLMGIPVHPVHPTHPISVDVNTLTTSFTDLALDGTARRAEEESDQFALFSSKAIPDDKTKAKNCGLPFGLLLTPLLQKSDALSDDSDSQEATSSSDTTSRKGFRNLQSVDRPLGKCSSCGAYFNSYCKSTSLTSESWICVFCNNSSAKNEERSYHSGFEVVEYADSRASASILGDETNSIISTHAFVIDANVPQQEFNSIKRAVETGLQKLPSTSRVALIIFSNIISIYELGRSGVASAEVYPANRAPSKTETQYLISRKEDFIASVESCAETVKQILEVLAANAPITSRGALKGNQSRGLGAALKLAISLLSPLKRSSEETPQAPQEKTGAETSDNNNEKKKEEEEEATIGQILVCTDGCPNVGPGAIFEEMKLEEKDYHREQANQFYNNLGMKARKHNISIDLFCGGLKSFNVRILQNLVLPNGGVVILFREFDAMQLAQNFAVSLTRWIGRNGTIDIRTSAPVAISHMIGPALFMSSKSAEGITGSSRLRCRLSGVQEKNCYTIYFEHLEDILADNVYFQFVIKYQNRHKQNVVRVYTKQIIASGSKERFIQSIDPTVVSLLIAKRAVLQSRKAVDPDDPIEYIDKFTFELVTRCGKKDKNNRKRISLPTNLADIPYKLFLARQGALLGPILQHPDDIDFLRCLFLNADYEDSMRLMNPALLLVQNDGFKELPMEDLALQSNFILYLDHHTDIFIWSGKHTWNKEEHDRMRTIAYNHAKKTSKNRYPQPSIMQFKEGSSQARWLQCRLIPSHKDSLEDQLNSFPQLRELTDDTRRMLLAKFHPTDDLSFEQYYKKFNFFEEMS